MKMELISSTVSILQLNDIIFLIDDKKVMNFSCVEKLICYLVNYYDNMTIKDLVWLTHLFERNKDETKVFC